ncbi:uncharacterized protein PHALS_10095 [Plasmopara halstedii]|uniref:Uncharacterized protein n=1 Tax=Plasmopara halstedii TaxID=4781 RepID=A0A0P1AFJ2_PLAHL|nr:uncharacterized protein PHALS_10095 [Plasmopara halstedii]CEG39864.1 hypothetical protein PHALS_10095 [Plasmopara halstedii]|eukprot:XP_024576233.1 hypothetical protein PHALS_10095 [Plasmopara halstedii]
MVSSPLKSFIRWYGLFYVYAGNSFACFKEKLKRSCVAVDHVLKLRGMTDAYNDRKILLKLINHVMHPHNKAGKSTGKLQERLFSPEQNDQGSPRDISTS